MAYIYVIIGSANGLLSDHRRPLPEPMLSYHRWGSVHLRAEVLKVSIRKISLKIAVIKSLAQTPGPIELSRVIHTSCSKNCVDKAGLWRLLKYNAALSPT